MPSIEGYFPQEAKPDCIWPFLVGSFEKLTLKSWVQINLK